MNLLRICIWIYSLFSNCHPSVMVRTTHSHCRQHGLLLTRGESYLNIAGLIEYVGHFYRILICESILKYKAFSASLLILKFDQLFKSTSLSKKASKKSVRCILCYSRCIALHFQLLQLVCLTNDDRTFTKQGRIAWIDSTCFEVQPIKKKGKHGKYNVEVRNGKYST